MMSSEKHNGPAELVKVIVETVSSSGSKSDIASKDDEFFPPGSQIDEYDDNKVRKIYLDPQEKRFETLKKRDIQNSKIPD